jgi:predicted MFS family arabinose efflux permease
MITLENFYIGLFNSGLTPVQENITRFYGVSKLGVIMTSFSYLAGIVLFSFGFNFVCQRFSLRNTNFIGLGIILFGSSLKLLVNQTFWVVFFGQFICGLGGCIIVNIQISVAFHWFSERSRGIALGLISISNLLGMLLLKS